MGPQISAGIAIVLIAIATIIIGTLAHAAIESTRRRVRPRWEDPITTIDFGD